MKISMFSVIITALSVPITINGLNTNTADCSDFQEAYEKILLEKIQNPDDIEGLVCNSVAQTKEQLAWNDPDAYFTETRYGEYAECAKLSYLDNIDKTDQEKINAILSSDSVCREEVANEIALLTKEVEGTGDRKLVAVLAAIAAAAHLTLFGLIIILPGAAIGAGAVLAAKAREGCTRSDQCPRNRCCAKNLRGDRVCLPTPLFRGVRERKCLSP